MNEKNSPPDLLITPISEVIERFRRGEMVIMVDDCDRENEGDLVVATELLNQEKIAFMMREARGLICVSISGETAERLGLPLQAIDNSSQFHTPFTISIDARAVGVSGVTGASRVETMRALVDPNSNAQDFVTPGHVFPLIAHADGVLGRQGQTEGSYDLARLSGMQPSGVICEIMNEDGTMARGRDLAAFAQRHSRAVTSVEEIVRYRVQRELLVREVGCRELETNYGPFVTHVFEDDIEGKEHLALTRGDLRAGTPLVRIHSECLTGDIFGSRRCDCGPQLAAAMTRIDAEGCGIVLYLRQEGRGIGLGNKLRAYALQDLGHDTVEANLKLGFPADARDFAVAAKMLSMLGVTAVRLMTNNPDKVATLNRCGITVLERIPLIAGCDSYSEAYLETKRTKLGHLF